MLKKYISSVILFLICLGCLFSCKQTGDPSGGKTEKQITIVYADAKAKAFADELSKTFAEKLDYTPVVVDSASAPSTGAITVGSDGKGISLKAQRRIENMEEAHELSAQYVVYSDGANLAIAYSDKVGFEAAANVVLDHYEKNGGIIASRGVLSEGQVSYRERAEIARNKMRAEQISEVAATHGSETAQALEKFYTLFDDEIYIWMANLWDPEVGGFYYSNSARDNVGFLPDLESTAQILSWLEKSGLVEAYGSEWENALPASMKTKILFFAQSLQDPDDGFFYHPQWTKESTTISRRGRDNGWALSIISQLGGEPLYPNATTPSEEPDLVAYGGLTEELGKSSVLAVSKVIPTANDLLPAHLKSPDAFEEYIRSLNLNGDSYASGNTLAAQHSQIKAAGQAVIRRMFDVLAELQFPSTGMWEDTVSYNAVNGLFKISSLYQRFDEPIPYADVAVNGVIEVLKNPEGAAHVCSVYNPWATLVALKGTMSVYEWDNIQKTLYSEAAALIDVTREKYIPCLVDAGGFSYYHGRSASTSQGMMVATPSTYEADVNGTGIAFSALQYVTQILGVGSAKIYCEEDYDYFINTIGSLGEIIKDEEMIAEPITFDDEFIPNNVTNNIPKNCEQYISFNVVDDPYPTENTDDGLKDMAMCVEVSKNGEKYATSSSTTQIPVMNPFALGFCYAVEMDFMYESTDATSNMMTQLFLQDSKTSFGIAFNVYSKGSEKKIRIVEQANSGTKDVLATGLDFGEWIHLRVEFYRMENKAIIYVNGEPKSVADLYYEGSEERTITKCGLLHYRAVASRLYLDNILVEKLDKAFVPLENDGGGEDFGTDDGSATAKGKTTYEDGCPSADNVKIVKNSPSTNTFITFDKTSNSVAALLNAKNNALRVETFKGYTDFNVSYIDVMNVDYSSEKNGFEKSYTFEADMYVDPATATGWVSQMFLYTGTSASYSISLRVLDLGSGNKCVRISQNSTNDNRDTIVEDGIIKVGEWFNLKIVFYKGSSKDGSMTAARYFVNNKYCAEDRTYRNAAVANEAPIECMRVQFYSRDTKTLMYFDNLSFTEKDEILPAEPEVEIGKEPDPKPETDTSVSEVTDNITELLGTGNSATKISIKKETLTQYNDINNSASKDNIERASYTFEAKLYVPSGFAKGNTPIVLTFNDGSGANYQGVIVATADGKLSIRSNVASNEYICGTVENGAFECNKWVNIRIVLYKEMASDRTNCGVKVWIDGNYAGSTEGDLMNGTTVTNGVYAKSTNGKNITNVVVKWGGILSGKTAYIDDVSLTEQLGASFSDAE